MSPRTCLTWLLLAFLLAALPAHPQTPQDAFEGIHRVVAIGDVQGDYPRFLEILRTAELIDGKPTWKRRDCSPGPDRRLCGWRGHIRQSRRPDNGRTDILDVSNALHPVLRGWRRLR